MVSYGQSCEGSLTIATGRLRKYRQIRIYSSNLTTRCDYMVTAQPGTSRDYQYHLKVSALYL